MFHVVLYQPEIPPNTGNIIRLCANTGANLHLVEPLGFDLDEPRLRRAGLDYHEYAEVHVHANVDDCLRLIGHPQVLAFSSKASTVYTDVAYEPGAVLLFGPETRGLPRQVLDRVPESRRLTLPMMPGNRSLNLSNAVAVVVYEGWRQNGFRA
ncbi:MAG: tRNA (cytidine(34)-2'-O)-methyltransferase [Gammaproteobacteria bacterium]|nr:MAG: tRNA (cytidine(34)-2'-O)-methyltransferase [Gammaproteobacteria bacterium]